MEYCNALRETAAKQYEEIERLKPDAERGRFVVEYGGWYRSKDQGDGLMIRVPHGTDLSCKALREMALDRAAGNSTNEGSKS